MVYLQTIDRLLIFAILLVYSGLLWFVSLLFRYVRTEFQKEKAYKKQQQAFFLKIELFQVCMQHININRIEGYFDAHLMRV